jgi:hypothetical protein
MTQQKIVKLDELVVAVCHIVSLYSYAGVYVQPRGAILETKSYLNLGRGGLPSIPLVSTSDILFNPFKYNILSFMSK